MTSFSSSKKWLVRALFCFASLLLLILQTTVHFDDDNIIRQSSHNPSQRNVEDQVTQEALTLPILPAHGILLGFENGTTVPAPPSPKRRESSERAQSATHNNNNKNNTEPPQEERQSYAVKEEWEDEKDQDEEDATIAIMNRRVIQDILDATTSSHNNDNNNRHHEIATDRIHNRTWLSFRSIHGGKIDITRNVPRVQDFYSNATSVNKSQQQQDKKSSSNDDDNNNKTNNKDRQTGNHTKQTNNNTSTDPLNIVLFYADDWTMEVLGALNQHVHTPHLDEMAKRGMLFTRNCVTTSICWISRNTLATGVYSSVHGNVKVWGKEMFNHSHFAWEDTLYPLLKQQGGYVTGLVGKWHAPTPQQHMKAAFDQTTLYYGRHTVMRDNRLRHVTDLNREDALAFLRLWEQNYGKNATSTRATSAGDESSRRRHHRRRPFFLQVSFFATHAWRGHNPPYVPMNESMHMYRNVTIPRPHTATKEQYDEVPWFLNSNRKNEARIRNKNRFDTDDNYQTQIKNLYRMASEVDAVVGTIVDQLKQMNEYNNTFLVFTTDNGNSHGHHGLAEKWFPFEESIRVPLIIQDPRMSREFQGTDNEEFTLNVDLAPTLLSVAQIPVPSFMQGRDITQLYLNPQSAQPSWRRDYFYEWNTVRV